MKFPLFKKVLVIVLLAILLMIPLTMIEGVVHERSSYRYQARNDIAQSWTGGQQVFGPLLVVPYRERYLVKIWNKESKQYENKQQVLEKQLLITPDSLNIEGNVATEMRQRGIYAVPVYLSQLQFSGRFNMEDMQTLVSSTDHQIEWLAAHVSVLVSDVRGIKQQPILNWQGQPREFAADSLLRDMHSGMHAVVGKLEAGTGLVDFDFKLMLNGMEEIKFSPIGKSTTVNLNSDWADPSFIGRYLPTQRNITQQGFNASWKLASFSSDIPQQISACEQGECSKLLKDSFGVRLFNSVDIYQQSERSVKYAMLFIGLTFMSFFLYEVMKGLRLHPMQYLLVGLGLSIFYLLLISLSEHMAFVFAYLLATLASTGLIGFYISSVLQSRVHGMMISGVLLLLYAMLYGILRSEDNSLLMGSLLSFAVLSLFMVVTRRIDWYSVTDELTARISIRKPA
jgi:inner membrane protein